MPVTQLPKAPASVDEQCIPLTEIEKTTCLKMSLDLRKVCHKVERNARICEADKSFVKRLYDEIDES